MKRQVNLLQNRKGMIGYFTLGVLVVLEAAGLAMLSTQSASLNDTHGAVARGQAKFMAQTALQESKYYIKTVSPGWTGSRPEQVVSVGNKNVGSYEYKVTANGNQYTVVATGYVPNKASKVAISQTITTTFSYPFAINPGVIVLESSGANALSNGGNSHITVYGGKIYVNSSHATAVNISGSASLASPEMDIVGSYTKGNAATISGTIKQGTTAVPDPLASLTPPDKASLVVRSNVQYSVGNHQSATLQPGVYNGGISIGAGATATMNPGIYYIYGGGFKTSGSAVLTGNGVMIYNEPTGGNNDDVNVQGTGNVTLTPMTTGTYAGIAIWQLRSSNVEATLLGGGSLTVSGIIYIPGANVKIGGNSDVNNIGTLDICKTLSLQGTGNFAVNSY